MSIVRTSQAAIFLLVLAVVGCSDDDPVRPHSAGPRTRWVAPDGSGQYRTIQAAINASADGDTVVLRNGRYDGVGNLDLDFGGRDLVLTSKSGDPIYCVIGYDSQTIATYRGMWFHNDETASATVQNVTIEHGSPEYGGGGAVLCEGASPTFRNVIFYDNFVDGVVSIGGSPTFVDCVFQSNTDGALRCRGGSPRAVNCLFAWNYAGYSGASVDAFPSNIRLEKCVFLENGAEFSGAALSGWGNYETRHSAIEAIDCLFLRNMSGYHGGAVSCMGTQLTLSGCVFSGNACGMMGGAVECSYQSGGVISDCVFYGNSGTEGSALNCQGDSLLVIERSVFQSNSGSAPIRCGSYTPGPIAPSVRCSDIYGNADGDWNGCVAGQDTLSHNIAVDPMFCNAADNDFTLQTSSPLPGMGCPPLQGWTVGCATPGNVGANWRRLVLRAERIKASMDPPRKSHD